AQLPGRLVGPAECAAGFRLCVVVDAEGGSEPCAGEVAAAEGGGGSPAGTVGTFPGPAGAAVAVGVEDAAHRARAGTGGVVVVAQGTAGDAVGGVEAADRAGRVGAGIERGGIVAVADGVGVEGGCPVAAADGAGARAARDIQVAEGVAEVARGDV